MALAAVVVGYTSVATFKMRHLVLPHAVVKQQSVRKNNGLGAAALFLKK